MSIRRKLPQTINVPVLPSCKEAAGIWSARRMAGTPDGLWTPRQSIDMGGQKVLKVISGSHLGIDESCKLPGDGDDYLVA